MGTPLLVITPMAITGDELFDAIFTLVVYFGCLALPVAAIASLLRLVVVGSVCGLLLSAGVVSAEVTMQPGGSVTSVDCSAGGAVTFTAYAGTQYIRVYWASQVDRSDEVPVGTIGVFNGNPVSFPCSGYMRFWDGNNYMPATNQSLAPDGYPGSAGQPFNVLYVPAPSGGGGGGLSDDSIKKFWMAGAGLMSGSFLVWAGFRAFGS